MGSDYAFGDSELASRRLQLLARIFLRSSREFICEATREMSIESAVDLASHDSIYREPPARAGDRNPSVENHFQAK
ncbi:MAG: hypothetical protein ACREAC_21415, partial [Blastocatellia bacterium]